MVMLAEVTEKLPSNFDGVQSPPDAAACRPRCNVRVPVMCVPENTLAWEVTVPEKCAVVVWPAVEPITSCIVVPDVPKPTGAFQVKVPEPPIHVPITLWQLRAFVVRNETDIPTACTYGPEHVLNVAPKLKLFRTGRASKRPGVARTFPRWPEQVVTLWACTPAATTGPTVAAGLEPRALSAVTMHVYVLPAVSLFTMIGLVACVGLVGAPPSGDVHRAR